MKYSMLIIDDSKLNRDILGLLFEDKYEVIEAEDGDSGIDILESCHGNIDVILLDLIMPKMDGFEVMNIIKTKEVLACIPIVVITSSNNVEDQISAFSKGASDFITKPFVPEIVKTRVNNVVDSTKRYKKLRNENEVLQQKAELDLMTGLFNKETTEELIEEQLTKYPDKLHAMMIIDIDNFKGVNDLEGHLVGDHTIKIIANQILSYFRSTDIIGRVGGDEFMVFMANIPSKDIARRKANELAMLLKYKPNLTIPANVSVSIGLAFSDLTGPSLDDLYKSTDAALYTAKKNGKARMCEGGEDYSKEIKDERRAILLFSRNRNVCSTVQAVYNMTHLVLEVMTFENIKEITDIEKEKIDLCYIDVSDESDDGMQLWNEIKEEQNWISSKSIIAICDEGELSQFRIAMENDVSDILTVPIDIETLKRRTRRYLNEEIEEIVAKNYE